MAVTQLDDQQLIERLKAGDEAALEVLMTQYQTRVFGLALRMTGNRQDAEEVLQDVFLAVVQKIGTFRGEAKLSTWIYRIASNASLMKLPLFPRAYARFWCRPKSAEDCKAGKPPAPEKPASNSRGEPSSLGAVHPENPKPIRPTAAQWSCRCWLRRTNPG